MKNTRLTFNTSTNFTIPIRAYSILREDAIYHGFIKNNEANISGFLNHLIPALSECQEDLYQRLLAFNNDDEEEAKKAARNIYSVYLKPFAFGNDGVSNVPLRINKGKYNEFLLIHDRRLHFYDTDFTNYLRTLIAEYASKTFPHREVMYHFPKVTLLKQVMSKNLFCKFLCDVGSQTFVPVSIETSPITECNYVVGVDSELQPRAIRLHNIKQIIVLEEKMRITQKLSDKIESGLMDIYVADSSKDEHSQTQIESEE